MHRGFQYMILLAKQGVVYNLFPSSLQDLIHSPEIALSLWGMGKCIVIASLIILSNFDRVCGQLLCEKPNIVMIVVSHLMSFLNCWVSQLLQYPCSLRWLSLIVSISGFINLFFKPGYFQVPGLFQMVYICCFEE